MKAIQDTHSSVQTEEEPLQDFIKKKNGKYFFSFSFLSYLKLVIPTCVNWSHKTTIQYTEICGCMGEKMW